MSWIKCSEKMPEDQAMYWLRFKDGSIDKAIYFKGQKIFGHDPWGFFTPENITHWAPITPPEFKEEDENS